MGKRFQSAGENYFEDVVPAGVWLKVLAPTGNEISVAVRDGEFLGVVILSLLEVSCELDSWSAPTGCR